MKLYLKDAHPLLYLSGTGTSGMGELDIIAQGAKYRCYSYAYVCPGGFYYQKKMQESLETSVSNNLGIMMDSAAHSFHKLVKLGLRKSSGKWTVKDMIKLRDETVKNYSKFVRKNKDDWDWYVNFDYVKECPIVWEMQKQLESLKIKPVPVYHGDQSLDWLKRYCEEGHKLICIGSVKRNHTELRYYYNQCYDLASRYGVHLHGLAVTSLSLMFGIPWYSVDSATWAKVAAFGCILCTSETINDTFGYIHLTDVRHSQSRGIEIDDLSPEQLKHLENTVNDDGFDLDVLRVDGAQRSLYNIYVFSNKIQHLKKDIAASRIQWKNLLAV